MIALNITALTALTKAVLPCFQKRNSGTIINIGSNVGFTGFSWVPIYGATKAYVLNFTQALQQQLAGTGVRIQLVTPGATVSEILQVSGTPMSNLDPETVMSTENCVDAALRGLDINELSPHLPCRMTPFLVAMRQPLPNFFEQHGMVSPRLSMALIGHEASRADRFENAFRSHLELVHCQRLGRIYFRNYPKDSRGALCLRSTT